MRFCVDAHAIGRKLTGNEVYIRNLLRGFASVDAHSEFVAYISEPGAENQLPSGFQWRRVSGNPFARLGWDMTRRLHADRPDLLHVQYTAPLRCPVPVVVTVHDVSYLEQPAFLPPARAEQLKLTVDRTVRRAARVLTPSDFSAGRIRKVYNLPHEQVVVVPNAVSPQFRPMAREAARVEVDRRFGLHAPYVLMVGDLQPRKNQRGLIRAFEELLRLHPSLPHHLVLVGKDGWSSSQVREAARRSPARDRIHCTGFVSDEDVPLLYGGCDMLAFPSLYEGFGLPVLEAMACGRAVCCSNSSATVEVADGAAVFFDPRSTADIMRALRDLLVDHELRARMERLGIQRASAFTWKESARRTLEVFYQVAGERPSILRESGVRA